MKCRELMNIDLRLISASASVKDAATLMRENALGFLPVCGADGRLAGVLTDRDVAVRAATIDRLPATIWVAEVMTTRPAVCRPHESVRDAEARMSGRCVSRLVVIDDDGHPVGVVSLTDVLAKDHRRRALRTALRVLSREAQGPHTSVEDIHLTPAPLPSAAEPASDWYPGSRNNDAVIIGGAMTRDIKEFPR
jgi:CBS domain-containing protein